MKEKIILIGGGGHCKACIDVIEQEGNYQIAGIVDLPEMLHQKVLGYEIIAIDKDLPDLVKEYKYFLIALGQVETANKRIEIFIKLNTLSVILPRIISPLAYVSKYSKIGKGTIIMHHALVNAGAKIGTNCIINSKSLIEHDAVIKDHCHISTGAIINGGVRVCSGTFFGSNAVSREYIEIEKDSVIGCAARVEKNIPSGSIVK